MSNDINFKIKQNQCHVYGDFLEWYDDETDSLYGTCPIYFENGGLLEIDNDSMVIEMENGFVLYETDGIGNLKKFLYKY